ncbi:glycosyltransferase family A protein [Algoriphagus hitonicola]|uniref:Glycosyl transferase family 2 n=1 Tax=Algoriphagus hitonicola TaxID=435880 RepID=A0A1I2X4B8_9BACT|nr:glycosyltransferase family A protein [Algoriphagus hitonicola]SFH08262.1 Glycosyl transferase family 2 [Algoriphagus hitonicola]
MRIGNNPEKEKSKISKTCLHRIIVPVYIPNLDIGYFKDGLEILKICLKSLFSTTNNSVRISVFNNGSCEQVEEFLLNLYNQEDRFDQILNSKVNIGKVNAINAVVKSTESLLYTISDADVMFLQGWQQNVEEVFNNFPEAGMVSPVPSSKAFSYYTASTLFYGLFKGKLSFEKVRNPNALCMFEQSIGSSLYKPCHLRNYLVVNNNSGKKAVMGCGHFVATLRKEVFYSSPNKPSDTKISGGSEATYIDIPNDVGGFLRLATLENYAYHLGNVLEPWMNDFNDEEVKKSNEFLSNIYVKSRRLNNFERRLSKFFSRFFFGKFSFLFKKIYNIPKEY